MSLLRLYRYPLKSGAAEALDRCTVDGLGLTHDRRWMLVDPTGQFITGRQSPALVRIQTRTQADGLHCEVTGHPPLLVPPPAPDADRLAVEVWGDRVSAACAGESADRWFSTVLEQDCRLVSMDARSERAIDPGYARPGEQVSFADGFPLLLIGSASLQQLNETAGESLHELRFRPNLIVATGEAHEEDRWRRIRIGDVTFRVAKPCARCQFTTVDPFTGERHPHGEPLRSLARYRRQGSEVLFGQNLIAETAGDLRPGDPLTVLE